MSGGINSPSQSTHDRHAGIRQLVGNLFGAIVRVVAGLSRPDHTNRVSIPILKIPHDVEHRRRIVNLAQQSGVVRRCQRNHPSSKLLHQPKLASQINVTLPIPKRLGRLRPNALDRLESRRACRKHSARRPKSRE